MPREVDRVGIIPLRVRIFSPAVPDDQNEWSLHEIDLTRVPARDKESSPQRRRERRDECEEKFGKTSAKSTSVFLRIAHHGARLRRTFLPLLRALCVSAVSCSPSNGAPKKWRDRQKSVDSNFSDH
jgi:hypothetical protein